MIVQQPPRKTTSCRESCNSELTSEMNNDSYESTSAVDLLTKKMDTVLAKLQKLDGIENRQDNLFKAMSHICRRDRCWSPQLKGES